MKELIYSKKSLQKILGLNEPIKEVYFNEHDIFIKIGDEE